MAFRIFILVLGILGLSCTVNPSPDRIVSDAGSIETGVPEAEAPGGVQNQPIKGSYSYPVGPAGGDLTGTYPNPKLKSSFNVQTFGAKGDGTTDDTTAIQTAINAAEAAGGGTVSFPWPSVTYKITSALTVTSPGVLLQGTAGPGTLTHPYLTQYTYGAAIVLFSVSDSRVDSLSWQYGPQTTLSAPSSPGATSVNVVSASGLNIGDQLVFDQWGPLENSTPMETALIASIAGTTINLAPSISTALSSPGTSSDSNATNCGGTAGCIQLKVASTTGLLTGYEVTVSGVGGTVEANGVWTITVIDPTHLDLQGSTFTNAWTSGGTVTRAGGLANAHASGSWVRDQAAVTGSTTYNSPPRDLAGAMGFVTGDDCEVSRCAALAVVTAVKYRGEPGSNSINDSNNSVSGLRTAFVQFGILAQQQTHFRVRDLLFEHATDGQTTAPGHGLYMTGLIGPGGAWSGAVTYNIYQQVYYNSIQYISIQASNLNHQPDISPTFWSAQTVPSSSTGWRSKNQDLRVSNIRSIPNDQNKDWSGVKIKFTDGATVDGVIVEQAVRGIDLQECNDCAINSPVFRNFVPPLSTDSAAAAVTSLNCNHLTVSNPILSLSQTSTYGEVGSSIDMPAIYDRLDGTIDPVTSVALGHDNSFINPRVFTNYDSSFTSAAVRVQTQRASVVLPYFNEAGGLNPYAVLFSSNGTAGTFANGGVLIRPTVVGTTHIASVSTGTTTSYWDIDNNLIPASPSFNDVNGIVTTNRFITNSGGAMVLSPQSTTTTWIQAQAPTGHNAKSINFNDSSGNTTYSIDTRQQSSNPAIREIVETPAITNPAQVCLGSNTTGGYYSTSNTMASIIAVANGGSCSTNGAAISAIATENQNSGALGTDWQLSTVTAGGTTQMKNMRLFGNGDVSLNNTGNALATSATGGYTFIPSMAGAPSGSLSGHTGTVGVTYDSTDHSLFVNTSSTNDFDVKSLFVAASGPSNGTTFTCGSLQRLGSGQSGNSYNIPNANGTCTGQQITVECTNSGGVYTYTINPAAGTIDGASSYTLWCDKSLNTVTFVSDGSNWATERPRPPTNYYPLTPPVEQGYVEWNGDPGFVQGKTNMVSQTIYAMKLVAHTGGTIANINGYVGTAGNSFTAATTTNVTGTASSGGLIQLSVASTAGLANGNVVTVSGVTGTTEANGAWVLTSVASPAGTVTLQNSTWTNAWVSGGTLTLSGNIAAIYSSSGNFLTATGDMSTTWNGTGAKAMPLATSITTTLGTSYYVVLLFNGNATVPAFENFGNITVANSNLSAANFRWSTASTAAASLSSSFTPSSNLQTTALTYWVALN